MLLKKAMLLTLGTITALSITACSDDKNSASSSDGLNISSIESNTSLSPSEKAEQLSLGAQRLITPTSYMYAYEVAERALKHDSKNARARLVKALFAPTMELKGVVTRIAPFVARHESSKAGYAQTVQDIKALGVPAYTEFLLSGPQDLQTESDIQEVVARVTARLDDLRRTLNDLKGEEVTLSINTEPFAKDSLLEAAESCKIERTSDGFDWSGCAQRQVIERKLNRADFEMLKQMVAGLQVYLTVYNAYDMNGVAGAAEKAQKTGAEAALRGLLANGRFATLRKTNGFGVIPDIAQDAVLGAREAIAMQSEYCPGGVSEGKTRPGHLFESGICVTNTDEAQKALAMIETAAHGSTVLLDLPNGRQLSVSPMKFFTAPTKNLRSALPLKRNECGKVSGINERAFSEVFPNGDLNQIIAEKADCN